MSTSESLPDLLVEETSYGWQPSAESEYPWWLWFFALLAALGGFAGVLVWWDDQKPLEQASEGPAEPLQRVLPGMVLVPSPNSQAEDLWLALEEPSAEGSRWLGRVNGFTGRVVWKRIADLPGLADGVRAWIDGVLFVASSEKLFASSPETGESLWTRSVEGPIRDLCSGPGFVGVVLADDRFAAFSVSTGEAVANPVEGKPPAAPCGPVVTTRSSAPNFSVVDAGALDPPLPARPPFDGAVARVLVPNRGTARVVLTTDRLAATVGVATRRSWVWSTRLGRRSHGARLLSPPLAAVRNERVLVPYVLEPQSELRLASLELASGRVAWDVSLTSQAVQAHAPDAELRISRLGYVYFSDGRGRLWVTTFDSQLAWTLGVE